MPSNVQGKLAPLSFFFSADNMMLSLRLEADSTFLELFAWRFWQSDFQNAVGWWSNLVSTN
jgi:hypothetical protein